ncbi:LysR family transcriptional regulator [Trinickia caryophylli]|uniref:Transcriptional regulator, LysR family n=1 Tax=Trinickia caryophylli TaxID=28094 RepID=A0A1X7F302_TRICW|nr:LysR family transcriptional regulator [Trinickia caryophylli]PMS10368.1 LysR family transcriptional regulator [Trinickia caryophylli]TRX19508.1 LysR family transcriptional regulator [Trinickia caryophylli]WQE13181.1 LysR family transcriptional regulator [Trinickia caryophylli]SMF44484.1 transcriptional regulator, LysR family [Trinickia caryophylli]GLU34512.1 LysR family transcriptional regulator [Trinickia caryophylli]
MDLSLRDIRAFVAVADTGSFTRAAARLHLSQPALTVQIRRLEEALGARLFDRNSRSVALTALGRELLPLLQKTLNDMENVLYDARALSAGAHGRLRLACLPSFASSALPDCIRSFAQAMPGVTFDVRDAVASAVDRLVRDEDVDLGVTGGDAADPTLEVLHAASDRLCVVCPSGHPLASKRRIGIADLLAHSLVLTAPGTSVRAVVDAAFDDAGCVPTLACEPTYMMSAVAMVKARLGVTILPMSAREIRAERSLVAKAIDDRRFTRRIALVKKRGRTLPRVAQAFAEVLAQAMKAAR